MSGSDKLTPRDHEILKKAGLSTADAAAMKSKYGPGSLSDDPPSAESRLTPKQKKILIGVAVGVGVGAAAWYLHGKVQVPNDAFLDNFDLDKAASLQIKAEVAAKKSYFKSIAEAKANSPAKTHFQQLFDEYQQSHTTRFQGGFSKDYVDSLGTDPIHLQAGAIFKRISTEREPGIKPKGFYACFDDADVSRYKAILPVYWKQWGYGKQEGYVVNLKAMSDVKAPSPKDTFHIFRNMLDDEIDVNMLGQVHKMKVRDVWFGSDGDLDDVARRLFPQAALNWNDDTNAVTKHFFSILKSQGYNAVIDMNDADALAKTPMRLLDGTMFSIAGHDVLSKIDIEKAQELIEAIKHALQQLGRMFINQGENMETQEEKTAAFLEHFGVKGMRWGHRKGPDSSNPKPRKPKVSSDDIKNARARVASKEREINRQIDKLNLAKGERAQKAAVKKFEDMEMDYLKDPDRVTAMRLTRGEKIGLTILAVGIPGVGTGAAAGVAGGNALARKMTESEVRKARSSSK